MSPKNAAFNPPPSVYRDDPDHAETASMASAVLLDEIDSFPDEELPAYEDNPSGILQTPSSAAPLSPARGQSHPSHVGDLLAPELPFSSTDTACSEFRTNFPNYSTEHDSLRNMIRHQASYPPGYYIRIRGKHTETSRHNNKEQKTTVEDFSFQVSMTTELLPRNFTTGAHSGVLEFLPDNKRGFRGTRFPSLKPTITDVEEADYLTAWCEKFVADPASVKSFTLKREIRNHDKKKLEQLVLSAVRETNYRGHIEIDFIKTHNTVVVYSPGLINQWRMTTWIRWVFYLTFLWIITWPVLFFLTSRYDVVKSVWKYASKPAGDEIGREPTSMSEVDFYHKWESAIKRAALARMICPHTTLDEDYRAATATADQRGAEQARNPQPLPSTGNAFADGAFSLLEQGLQVAQGFNDARGWGRDC